MLQGGWLRSLSLILGTGRKKRELRDRGQRLNTVPRLRLI